MKIILDNIIYFLQNSGGGSVYWSELGKRMNDIEEDVCFVEPKATSTNIFREKLSFNHLLTESRLPVFFISFLNFRKKLNEKHIFHSSYYRISESKNARNIVTIHDFTSERYFKGLRRWVNFKKKKHALMHADGVICISENTKKDLLFYHPFVDEKNIRVIYNGVGDQFYKLNNNFAKKDFAYNDIIELKYILYVGHRTSYKNFEVVPKTLALLDESYKLLIVGEPLNESEKKMLDSVIPNRYIIKSRIDSLDLNVFYNFAFCFLYPSSYEGFGIPVLEAMKAECPVVTTTMSSIPEVAGNSAIMTDKIDANTFADAIIKLENHEFRSELIESGLNQCAKFSWDKCFNEVLNFYREVYDRK